jgi:16S rRNA (cytidine1402-2'-O)-methyltransferase
MNAMAGTLYVVATPIGNLGDISPRALEVLRNVTLIAAEDTRTSGNLLKHFGIATPTVALHDHNERSATPGLVEKLQKGASIALVSDAGTPAISDPGAFLVDAALTAGMKVVPIPGPSAFATLLSASGMGDGPFLFYGFLPAKAGLRERALASLRTFPYTLVFHEAPHRICESVEAMASCLGGERRVVLGRELTKLFESIHRCTLAEARRWLEADANRQKGEFVIAVEGASFTQETDPARHDVLLRALLEKLGPGDAVRIAVKVTGENRDNLYARALALKASTGKTSP